MRIKGEKVLLIISPGQQTIIEIVLDDLRLFPRSWGIWSPQLNETMHLEKSAIDHVLSEYLFLKRFKFPALIDIN